jgi:hypothetical protein
MELSVIKREEALDTFTLKIATIMYIETCEEFQRMKRINIEKKRWSKMEATETYGRENKYGLSSN